MINPENRTTKQIQVFLTIGDWSKDGHGDFEKVYYCVNYPVADIQQAYKDSCKVTGVQFNHNKCHTGKSDGPVYDQILTEYGNDQIRPHEIEALREHKVITDQWLAERQLVESEQHITVTEPKDVADLIMRFIALSMPDDFVYAELENSGEPINGWGDKNLNCQFGYGIY